MTKNDWTLRLLLLLIVLFLGVRAFQPDAIPSQTVHAQSAQFDHVMVISTLFLYKGQQGLLLLDKRNGNVWFMPRQDAEIGDPQFILRVPFEKLDKQP